jgi:hypothetical protein
MKQAVFAVHWERQKGKMTKEGVTHVVTEDVKQAITLFAHQYPDRVIESIYKEGDDLILPGLPT